jgi:hypothetical protein
VSAKDGRLHLGFLCWAAPDKGHGGMSIAASVARAMAQQPLAFSVSELRTRLSLVGCCSRRSRQKEARQAGCRVDLVADLRTHLRALAGQPENFQERDAWVSDAKHLHAATEWGKLHRVDISLTDV